MSVNSDKLKAIANEYKLTVNGVSFWTPYWRDEVPTQADQRPKRGILNGKGSAEQITQELLRHLESSQQHPNTPEEYRQYMVSIQLGVDCSGFAFHVLNDYLQEGHDISLADHLFKPREALLRDFHNPAYTHPEHITEELLQSQPEQVSLTKIQEFWGNQPVRLAGVRILESLAANVVVKTAAEIQPGDQIVMDGHDGSVPHVVLIMAVEGATVTYAHSGRLDARPEGDVGGVEYDTIEIIDPSKPMNHQKWNNQQLIREHTLDDNCQRRLKVLDEL